MTRRILLALRRLRETPGSTVVAITSLTFGLGLNILIYGFTSPALLKAQPYPDSGRIVDISMAPPGKPESRGPLTPPLYFLLRDGTNAAFDAVGVFDAGRTANVAGDTVGPAEHVSGHRITATGLAALGAKPLLGRLPATADEAGPVPTMLLSYPLWQRRFAGRADVVNQTVSVDGQPTQILGVMPEGFGLLDNSSDAWFTYSFDPTPAQATQHTLRGIGRLKPDASMADAHAAVKVALDEYAKQFPTRDKGWTIELTPWRDARFGGLRKPLMMVNAAVGGMLLLLCVNVALLLLARRPASGSATLRPEQSPGVVLTASVLLSLAGGVAGTVLAAVVLPALRAITPTLVPRLDEVGIGAGVLAFAIVLSIVAGLVFGIVPAVRAGRDTPPGAARTSALGWLATTLLLVLLAVQVTLAFVLLAGTGLGIRGVSGLKRQDIGVNPAGLLSADVYLPRSPYMTINPAEPGSPETAEFSAAGPALYDRIRSSLQTMPGVVQAAGVATPPFASAPFVQCFIGDIEHAPENQVASHYVAVTENYFNTMGIRIVRGRDFSSADEPDSPWVVLVNETMAKQNWPGAEAIGQKLTLTFQPNDDEPSREVIGVVADTLPFRGATETPPMVYVLHRQQAAQQRSSFEARRMVMSFIVRTEGDPLALGPAVRARIGTVDMTAPVAAIRSVESYLDAGQTALLQFVSAILGVVALVALVIAVSGVYALTAHGVSRHRRSTMVVLRVAMAVVIGATVGLVVWNKLGSVIAGFLTSLTVTPSDPVTLVGTGAVVATAAIVACLAAARRPKTAR
jgi:putative ABC transport system permease protein